LGVNAVNSYMRKGSVIPTLQQIKETRLWRLPGNTISLCVAVKQIYDVLPGHLPRYVPYSSRLPHPPMPGPYCITLRLRKESPEPTIPSTTSKATHSEAGEEHKCSEATPAMSVRSNKESPDDEATHDGLRSFRQFFLEWLGQELQLGCEVRSSKCINVRPSSGRICAAHVRLQVGNKHGETPLTPANTLCNTVMQTFSEFPDCLKSIEFTSVL